MRKRKMNQELTTEQWADKCIAMAHDEIKNDWTFLGWLLIRIFNNNYILDRAKKIAEMFEELENRSRAK